MKVAHDITQLIGQTPLIQLNQIPQAEGCVAQILVKLEGMNPAASIKDRIGANVIQAAEIAGSITPSETVSLVFIARELAQQLGLRPQTQAQT